MHHSIGLSSVDFPRSPIPSAGNVGAPVGGRAKETEQEGRSHIVNDIVEVGLKAVKGGLAASKLAWKGLLAVDEAVTQDPLGAKSTLKRGVLQAIADGGASMGLNPVRLTQIQRVFYQATSSARDKQGRLIGVPPYLEKMFEGEPPTTSRGAVPGGPLLSDWFADLLTEPTGDEKTTVLGSAVSLSRIREIGDKLAGDDRQWSVRTHSEARVRKGTLEIFKQQLDSVYPHNGDQLPARLRSYARLVDMRSLCTGLTPWLESSKPTVHRIWENAVDRLTPNWVGGQGTFAHRADPKRVGKVYSDLQKLAQNGHSDFADVVVGLERAIVAEEQTFWIKLLKEGSPAKRSQLLGRLAHSWASLSVAEETESTPKVKKYRDLDRVVLNDTYNRAEELGSVVEHTLKALTGTERETFRQTLLSELRSQGETLQIQDDSIRDSMKKAGTLSAYPGLNIAELLDEKASPGSVVPSLSRLRLASASEDAVPRILFPGQVPLSEADRQVVRRHRSVINLLFTQKERFAPRDLSALASHPELSERPIILGPYAHLNAVTEAMASVKPREKTGFVVGGGSQLVPSPLSIVLEGGGGKGFSYASSLKNFYGALEASPGKFRVDEFCGTSAGAITASLLAAGYTHEELGRIMESLSFSEFFSDHHQLTTGDDPQVGGVQRAGLFSTREMEKRVEQLLAQKLGIQGRPVTFADLPFRLKIPSTVVAGNAPPEVLEMLRYESKNGRAVFSDETTPNMSVAAAATASGAFPGAFEPPRLEIARPVIGENGEVRVERYWLQCSDGGLVDNLPLDLAGSTGEDKMGLIVPSHYSDGKEGGKSLSTLDFDATLAQALEPIHRAFYESNGPALGQFLAGATADNPSKRVVVTFDLREGVEDDKAAVIGETPAETRGLQSLAEKSGFRVSSQKETEQLLAHNTEKSSIARLGVLMASAGVGAMSLVTEGDVLRKLGEKDGGLLGRPVENVNELFGILMETLYDASSFQKERRFQREPAG